MNREDLFDRHLRGELNEDESAELKHLLLHDAAAGRAFVEHVHEVNLMVRVGSQLQSASPAQNVVPLAVPLASSGKSFRRWWQAAALAACLLGLAIIGLTLNRSPSRPTAPTVYVSGNGMQVTRDGALMDGDMIEVRPDDLIATSTNEIAVIAYENESTRLELFPGTVVLCGDVSAGKRFELRRGGLQARVAPQAPGQSMLITTPHAQATVIGTEFVVRADERATKLDVFQGKVELACRSNAKKVTVSAGYWASSTSSGTSEAKPLCKCSKCRGTNEPSNCPNLKKKNEK
ncbi:MAG TPA: FecR family protein [Methylomirabilota bacterium]|nr:FecR family protein [Methylomirabilota bacterium]